jgi:hypothetical protein
MVSYLVKFFIKFRQLGSLGHNILVHKVRSLELLKALFTEERETIVDQSKVQINTSLSQEETTVTSNIGTTLLIVTIQASQNFMMRHNVGVLDWFNIFVVECADNFIVVLYVLELDQSPTEKACIGTQ